MLPGATAQIAPRCRHFGVCGGCQLQDRPYPVQLLGKRARVQQLFDAAELTAAIEPTVGSPEEYGYRNRIRLRVERSNGELRVGYNRGGTREFLPITECPIAAPVLVNAAFALLARATADPAAASWLDACEEVELLTDAREERVLGTLLTRTSPQRKLPPAGLRSLADSLPEFAGAALSLIDARHGQVLRVIAEQGAAGLTYRVGEDAHWIARGGFFQVNRFLLPALVDRVCEAEGGDLAWDLFAGVGLFSRRLARSFRSVVAVESARASAVALAAAMRKLGPSHHAVHSTVEAFLAAAVVQRDRPELITVDPPRAGLGRAVCELLLRMAAPRLVYLSCDPETLAADLALLTARYAIERSTPIDLFPQTDHIETLVSLRLRP